MRVSRQHGVNFITEDEVWLNAQDFAMGPGGEKTEGVLFTGCCW